MTTKTYNIISKPFRDKPVLFSILLMINKLVTLFGYLAYPTLILSFLLKKDIHTISYILIPAVSFSALSYYRIIKDKKRPYEVLDIDPLIKKDTKGHSFPSRHVFSIFLIAFLWFYISVPIGILLVIDGCFLALVRVIGGVHYPSDVIVGAAVGFFCAALTQFSCILY